MTSPDNEPLRWRKSTRSALDRDCVEVATARDAVHLRDSKHPQGPVITMAPAAFTSFLSDVKNGEFDREPSRGGS